jgi:uncharacterized protein
MRALLDVNVIVALLDPDHTFHTRAHMWLAGSKANAWASCPITENGVLRVMCGSGYGNQKFFIQDIEKRLRIFAANTDHQFWSDNLSILNPAVFSTENIFSHRHITDSYLLALATAFKGRFVTFDRGVILSSVKNSKPENLDVI